MVVKRFLLCAALVGNAAAFSTGQSAISSATLSSSSSSLSAIHPRNNNDISKLSMTTNNDSYSASTLTSRLLAGATAISLPILLIMSPLTVNADEWGRETEAPTLFTGETVMICKRRGPLGACLETTIRTSENDNDKALKYFKDPSADVKRRQQQSLDTLNEASEGNVLIQKLRKQSVDNKEKNDLLVYQKTLLNDQGASFGPFDRQVVILNTDGRTFTLLQNPQAMRLKKAGYIEDRKFVIQPSQDVIDDALEGKNEFGDAIKGFFGGGDGETTRDVKVDEITVSSSNIAVDDSVESSSDAPKENVAVVDNVVEESIETTASLD
jgi:hypothetical protein